MNKLLIGSPIRQKPNVLKEFLTGIEEANKDNLDIYYYFVDDNIDETSSDLLKNFASKYNNVLIKKGSELFLENKDNSYICNDDSHFWNNENIQRITWFKDLIIEYCIQNNFDYLFFIDSDIVIQKNTLTHLISRNVEIVSNVFWTQWHPNGPLVPQFFWIPDVYQQFKSFNVPLTVEEANSIRKELVDKIKIPGIYPVDGLGACTMISLSALKKGVRFKTIPNLSLPGEDRHFCIRAGALGIDLYMDSVYPAYHIFREEYLSRVDEFKKDGFKFDMCQTFIETENESQKQKKSSIIKRIFEKIKRLLKK